MPSKCKANKNNLEINKNTKSNLPGSDGEHEIQQEFNTVKKALAFYNKQVLTELAPLMCSFIEIQEMLFISTADKKGECDCSYRAGSPGFVRVVNKKQIIYPEYNGNGVMASMGNIMENQNIGLLFIDFFRTHVGLHVNGKAVIIRDSEIAYQSEQIQKMATELGSIQSSRKIVCYIMIEVEEAYIHCSKHIPLLKKNEKTMHWGTDNMLHKGGDAFKVKKHPRPWVETLNELLPEEVE